MGFVADEGSACTFTVASGFIYDLSGNPQSSVTLPAGTSVVFEALSPVNRRGVSVPTGSVSR